MKIEITKIEHQADNRFRFEAVFGSEQVIGHITEFSDGEIRGFNFDEEFFDVLFAFDGLGRRFNCDYWSYRNGSSQSFPWNYGDHQADILETAIRNSKTQLASLRKANA